MFAPQHLVLLRCTWYASSACRRLQSTAPGSRAGRRLSPAVLAGKNDFEDVRDLFGDPPVVDEAQGPNSRTSSKKRSEEFRKLGRDLVTLPVRTLGRMALPADLMEAIEEHARIESKRGTGSVKKGRSRVEALMMGILRSYEPDKSARIEAATRSALAGEPFSPIEPVERPTKARDKKSKDHEVAADALARMWHRSLLDGDAVANADVFGSLARRGEEWRGPDRVELRQLIVKAQSEERDAAAADAAAAAAAAAADEPPRNPVRRPLVARTQLLAALKQLALGSLEDADVITIDEDEDADTSPR